MGGWGQGVPFCVCAGLADKSVFQIGQSSFFNYRGAEIERCGKFPCFASALDMIAD